MLIEFFRKGEILILSDNAVALSHVRDYISREATAKNVLLTMNADVTWESTASILRRVHPQLVNLIQQSQRKALSFALEEALTDQLAVDSTTDWMAPEFRDILQTVKENQPTNNRYTVEEYQSTFERISLFPGAAH